MTEKELFEEYYKTSRDYKFYIKHEMTEKQIFEFKNNKYTVDCVNDGWLIWQASAKREGFVLVPKEPTDEMAEAISFSANVCGGIAYDVYKAMLLAVEGED